VASDQDLVSLFEHGIRANASRLSAEKPVPTIPDHASSAPGRHISDFDHKSLGTTAQQCGPQSLIDG
jgi:hypothetical protein